MNHTKHPLPATTSDLHKQFHTLSDRELNDLSINEYCKYSDNVWTFKSLVAGQTVFSLNWKIKLRDYGYLTDSQHSLRLSWLKKLICSMLFVPSNLEIPAASTISDYRSGIKFISIWMLENEYNSPHELTSEVIELFLDELEDLILNPEEEIESQEQSCDEKTSINNDSKSNAVAVGFSGLGVTVVSKAIRIPQLLWDQRNVLEKMGIKPIPEHPFRGRAIWDIAQHRINSKENGWIPPLPDEVAIPILNKAAWFLNGPASDVLALVNQVIKARECHDGIDGKHPGNSTSSRTKRVRLTIDNFNFSILPNDYEPWYSFEKHDPFVENEGREIGKEFRNLVAAVQNSCALIIQSCTGVRISEICGIEAGINQKTGLPSCVRVEQSLSGLYELFILKAPLSKTEKTPRKVEWLLGMRPLASEDIPLPVVALQILNRLYSGWQSNAASNRLVLGFGSGKGVSENYVVLNAIRSIDLSMGMQDFISQWVDLSKLPDKSTHSFDVDDLIVWKEKKGKAFRTHMLRKTWGNFVLASNSSLLPAIQMQYHHISLAMSDSGYIGTNPIARDALDSVARQQTNLMIFEQILGRSHLAGRMGERIRTNIENIKNQIEGLPTSEAWKTIEHFTDSLNLQVFPYPAGSCIPMSRSDMSCHNSAGTPSTMRNEPNLYFREPSLCAGCSCFAIDVSRLSFWESRYKEYSSAYEYAKLNERELDSSRVIKSRADQAEKIIKILNSTLVAKS